MKISLVLLYLCSFIFSNSVYSQTEETESVIKAKLDSITVKLIAKDGEYAEHGSGIFVGKDAEYHYIVTAAHVVADQDVYINDQELEELSEEAKISVYPYNQSREKPAFGHVLIFDSELDLTVVRVLNTEVVPDIPTIEKGFEFISKCLIGEKLTAYGYPGNSITSIAKVPIELQSINYYNDATAFRASASTIETGNSGGPIFNSAYSFMGLVIQIDYRDESTTGVKSLKVLKLHTIINRLAQDDIPMNLLKKNTFAEQSWKPEKIMDGNKMVLFPPTISGLTFHTDGSLSGLSEGQYCVKNNQIIFYNLGEYGIMLTPISMEANAYVLSRTFLEKDKIYNLIHFKQTIFNNNGFDYLILQEPNKSEKIYLAPTS